MFSSLVSFLRSLSRCYIVVWCICLSYLSRDWSWHRRSTDALRPLFVNLPVPVNIVLNMTAFNAMMIAVLFNLLPLPSRYTISFSPLFSSFCFNYVLLPSQCITVAYTVYRFGVQACMSCLGQAHVHAKAWLNNMTFVTVIASVQLTQMAIYYFLVRSLEFLLPSSLCFSVSFPLHVVESSLMHCVRLFAFAGLFLALTTPLWRTGFELVRRFANEVDDDKQQKKNVNTNTNTNTNTTTKTTEQGERDDDDTRDVQERRQKLKLDEAISNTEVIAEIIYTTSQGVYVLFIHLVLSQCLQFGILGLEVRFVHLMADVVQIILINQIVSYKFAWLHQLAHSIRPLYNMVHVEHHICRGIYPTTSAAGVWEFFMYGGSITFSLALFTVPYMGVTMIYGGANIVVHTMWPHKKLLQYHTLHHVVHADVFNVNIPSPYDAQFSRDVRLYSRALESTTPFVRLPWLSDVVGALFMVTAAVIMHYGAGIGVAKVWHEMIIKA